MVRFSKLIALGAVSLAGVLAAPKGQQKRLPGGKFTKAGAMFLALTNPAMSVEDTIMGDSLFRPLSLGASSSSQPFLPLMSPAHPEVQVPLTADPDLIEKYQRHHGELTSLLANEQLMLNRFDQFHKEKYNGLAAKPHLKGEGVNPVIVQRFENFQDNVAQAYARNLRGKGKIVHGITKFSDMSAAEFENTMFGFKQSEEQTEEMKAKKAADILKGKGFYGAGEDEKKDWRDEGAVTPVKDQGQCGSCWAFSTVQSLESAALVQGLADKENPFIGAPQDLVSCDKAGMDNGCHGGLPANAFKYLKNHPLEPEKDDPYHSGKDGKDGKCKYDKSEGEYVVSKAHPVSFMGIGEDQDMSDYVLNKGPVSVGVAANGHWQTYQGGVLTFDQCPDNQPNHAVQVVGLDKTVEKPFWIVRNSWADTWGEEGFIRITYNENTCNVAYSAIGVEVDQAKKGDIQV